MKSRFKLILILMLCIVLSACGFDFTRRYVYMGFDIREFTVVGEKDTHGGFNGDGSYYLILDCSKKVQKAREIVSDWKSLPFTENLQIALYGGEKDGMYYGYEFAIDALWPEFTNGVYKFVDSHSEAYDESDDTDLLSRASFNFSVAVYDFETDMMYYLEEDT